MPLTTWNLLDFRVAQKEELVKQYLFAQPWRSRLWSAFLAIRRISKVNSRRLIGQIVMHGPYLISIQTPKQIIFDLHTKQSQTQFLHWTQVHSEPLHCNHDSFDHPHNTKSISISALKLCIFRRSLFWVLYKRYVYLLYSSNTYHINTSSTDSNYYWRVYTTVKPRKYCARIYHISYFSTWYTQSPR